MKKFFLSLLMLAMSAIFTTSLADTATVTNRTNASGTCQLTCDPMGPFLAGSFLRIKINAGATAKLSTYCKFIANNAVYLTCWNSGNKHQAFQILASDILGDVPFNFIWSIKGDKGVFSLIAIKIDPTGSE